MRFGHDAARPASSTIISAGIEDLDDGYQAAWVEFEVDAEQWAIFEEERRRIDAPGGMSISFTDVFARRGSEPYDILIAGDASHFPADMLLRAVASVAPPLDNVGVAHLFQFSWAPDPNVVFDMSEHAVNLVASGVLRPFLAEAIRAILRGFTRRNDARQLPSFELRVKRTPISESTSIKLTVQSDEELAAAMHAIPEILRATGRTAVWTSGLGEWSLKPPLEGPQADTHQSGRAPKQGSSRRSHRPRKPAAAQSSPRTLSKKALQDHDR